ncbi:MAG: VWA domain-containing protein, partial [Verrucomicrobiae bacterium]|nr:VWA domain-containing protein [Verrucomicrobiae bacterium]
KAEATLSATKATDEVAVAVFDESVRMIRDFGDLASLPGSARVGAFQSALSDAGVKGASWRSTRIGDALTEAAERLASASINQPPAEQEIVIISDFQEGADRDSLNRFAWPEDISVRPVAIAPDSDEGNLALHLVAAGLDEGDAPADTEEAADRNRRRVRISNGRDSTTEHFTLTWQGNPDSKVEGFLPAGASRVMPVPPRPNEELDGVLEVSGDGVVFDNRVYVARAQPRAVDVVYLGSEAKADDVGSPLFYLSRAMHRTSTIDPTVSAIDFDSALSQIDRLNTAQVVVIRTDASTPPALAEFLAGYTASGGMVITIVNEGTSADTLQKLTGISGLSLTEAKVTDYALLSGLDFEHPLLSPFAQAQIRDFTKIHTWRHRTLTLPEAASKETRVIAQFDGQSPAWLELPHPDKGGGRVFLFLSGWEPRESQLALSSKFVPLLYAMLGQAGFSAVKEPTRYVGQPIPLPANETEVSITLPDGSTQVAEADSGNEFSATETPGFYTVTSRDALGRPQARVHAINLAPSESRTEPADPAVALGDFGIPLTKSATDTTAALANATQEHRLEAEE